jgi:hypothetical protein
MLNVFRARSRAAALLAAALVSAAARARALETDTPPAAAEAAAFRHGAAELFWVPTLEQALAMARATGRPIFVMGYSLVQDGSTYTKLGEEFAACVF